MSFNRALILAFIVIVIDQISKIYIKTHFKINEYIMKLEQCYGIKLDKNEFNNTYMIHNPKLQKEQNYKLNYGVVFSVIAALVCELSLKYLILKSNCSFPKTHNLKKLYDKLPTSHKENLKSLTMRNCNFISDLDFENHLNSSSESFVHLRYSFEKNVHELNDIFLKGFKDALVKNIN